MVPPPTPHGINYDASFEPTDNNNKRKMRPPPPQAPPINFTPTSNPGRLCQPPPRPKASSDVGTEQLEKRIKVLRWVLKLFEKIVQPLPA